MSAHELDSLWRNDDFVIDWRMEPLLEVARTNLGEREDGQSYCLKIPAVLGGQYAVDNFGKMSTEGLIRFSGDLARQIQNMPEGSKVELRVTD